MPNPILRAGPFASSSNSFLAEPGTPSDLVVPVNCAKSQSSKWIWQSTRRIVRQDIVTDTSVTDYISATAGGSVSMDNLFVMGGTPSFFHEVQIAFRYQAAASFGINFTYNLSVDSVEPDGNEFLFLILGATSEFSANQAGGTGISGTSGSLTFPVAIVPGLVIITGLITYDGPGSPSAESRIQFSFDVSAR